MALFPPFYQTQSPKAFLAQLPKLCYKAHTGLEDGESAIGRAAPAGLAGLKSQLHLARTRKQPLTRATVLLASYGEQEWPERRTKDYFLTRSWETLFQRSF